MADNSDPGLHDPDSHENDPGSPTRMMDGMLTPEGMITPEPRDDASDNDPHELS